jgi:hypothetical protein
MLPVTPLPSSMGRMPMGATRTAAEHFGQVKTGEDSITVHLE